MQRRKSWEEHVVHASTASARDARQRSVCRSEVFNHVQRTLKREVRMSILMWRGLDAEKVHMERKEQARLTTRMAMKISP